MCIFKIQIFLKLLAKILSLWLIIFLDDLHRQFIRSFINVFYIKLLPKFVCLLRQPFLFNAIFEVVHWLLPLAL